MVDLSSFPLLRLDELPQMSRSLLSSALAPLRLLLLDLPPGSPLAGYAARLAEEIEAQVGRMDARGRVEVMLGEGGGGRQPLLTGFELLTG